MKIGYIGLQLAVVAFLCNGCAKTGESANSKQNQTANASTVSKLTVENYLRIKEGMPMDDVELILGKPSDIKSFYPTYHSEWKKGNTTIRVISENGKVKSKSQSGLE
jgi:outer membrane protein assembly factor BamE (lipoprotein component of BamABCDE complex)